MMLNIKRAVKSKEIKILTFYCMIPDFHSSDIDKVENGKYTALNVK